MADTPPFDPDQPSDGVPLPPGPAGPPGPTGPPGPPLLPEPPTAPAPPDSGTPGYDPGQTGYGAPESNATSPGYGTPYGSPADGTSGYGAPGYGTPGYGAPGYGAPGYGAPGYGAPGYGYGYGPPAPSTEGLAIGSLVASIVGFVLLCCYIGVGGTVAGLVMGIIARRKIAESNGALTGDGLALAGIIVGAIGTGLFIVLMILRVVLTIGTFGLTR